MLSVVLCTWNRAELLQGALHALTAQLTPPAHEIVVVDNASTDYTSDVVRSMSRKHPQLQYVYEARPGLSHARNAGVRASAGSAIAFVDDDIVVRSDWLHSIERVLARYPDAACAGGPVMPQWPETVPAWLTARHWAPLGIQDYGSEPLIVDARRPLCLIGANLVVRRSAFELVGPFSPALQRVRDGAGSTEDHEFHLRLWQAGLHGIYDPALWVSALVLPDRLRKRHHRAWHFGHGRHVARMRIGEIERSRASVLGVPSHLLRQAACDARGWVRDIVAGNSAAAFDREARLWFVAGFVRERLA